MSATAPRAVATTAVVVPVKAFGAAKVRLAAAVPPAVRADLARWTAGRVLDAALAAVRGEGVHVACDDDEVATWATDRGATVLWGAGLGLNGAIDDAVARVGANGADHVIVSHADLVLPGALRDLTPTPETVDRVVLVPDRRRDGTNVIARPCALVLPASYGAGSFGRHLAHALASGSPVTVRVDAQLSLDLDTEADLRHPMVAPLVAPLLDRIPVGS